MAKTQLRRGSGFRVRGSGYLPRTQNPQPRTSKGYYPLFADLRGRRVIVVGGGMVAQRKVTTLLRFGAKVTVINPIATQRLKRYAKQGLIRYVPRRFKACDVEGAWLVYAATNDESINRLVDQTARRLRIFTNVVDQPARCSFIAPAIMKRGELVIAISTGGASPTVAKRLRREFERTIGAEYAELLRLLNSLRPIAKRKLPSYDDRKRYFDHLVRGRVFELVRAGKTQTARREALAQLDSRSTKYPITKSQSPNNHQ